MEGLSPSLMSIKQTIKSNRMTEKTAKIYGTDKSVLVYKLNDGNWCDSVNCTDNYEEVKTTGKDLVVKPVKM